VHSDYFLTWTTYGTWLPGDSRGSFIDDRIEGAGLSRRKDHLRLASAQRLAGDPILLSEKARIVVDAAIREHAAHRRWPVLALNVRTNHVHLVLKTDQPPDRVMTSMKVWSTRALRAHGLVSPDRKVWTRHGSTRHLHTTDSLEGAIRYVNEYQ
jgi:REP element-mobilizing transposase RayT